MSKVNAESKPGAVDENVGCARDFAGRARGGGKWRPATATTRAARDGSSQAGHRGQIPMFV